MGDVELGVRSQLGKIITELEEIQKKAQDVANEFKKQGDALGDGLNDNVKKTEGFLASLRGLGGRVADQLRRDFKSLISVNALSDSLKLSNQFRDAAKETITLSDTIRKLGSVFGIAQNDFARFQTKMTKGLGEIGLSSEAAANTLVGLSTTPVRGEEQLLGYSRTAGMLSSIGNEKGQEGNIAGSLARVLLAAGKNVNNVDEVKTLAESVRRVFNQTGAGPTKTLAAMETLFRNMPKDLRRSITSSGLANLATASAVGGPNATKFIEEYLGKSPIARMAFEAQGGKGVFTDKGLDVEKFRKFAAGVMGRVGGDPRLAAQTLGLSEEAAEGFVRMAENLDKVAAAQEKVAKSSGDLNSQYRSSLGLSEAFKANLNRVKKTLADPLSWITQKGTDLLSGASGSDLGAGAVVAGGGALAALLAGFGLKGIGKGLGGGLAQTALKSQAAEAVTGEKTIPVYVVNASEIAAGGAIGGVGGAMGGLGGFLGKAGLVGAAGYAGYQIGNLLNPMLDKFLDENTQGKTSEGFEGNAVDRLLFKLDKIFGGESSRAFMNAARESKILIELNKRDLKESRQPTRGASN